VNKNKPINGLF